MTTAPISVVVIAYNQAGEVAEALDSVLAQTALARIREIVVVDDASTDGTWEVAVAYRGRDTRICPIRRRVNSGGCAAPRNDGLACVTAPYVAFLDGDDLWRPGKIAEDLGALSAHPEIGLLFSDYLAFDARTGKRRRIATRRYHADERDQLARFFVEGGPVAPSTAVVSRAALDQVGVFDPSMRFNEDSELWNRIASVAPIHHIPRAHVLKREWFGSLGSAKYALENLACKREITTRMLRRCPELARVAPRRWAEIAYKTALAHLARGERAAAKRALREALRANPWHAKARAMRLVLRLPVQTGPTLAALRRARVAFLGRVT